eukprot:Skav228486  [mRNA]  locus=scaffold1092:162278:162493:+ [translate_table: standard]
MEAEKSMLHILEVPKLGNLKRKGFAQLPSGNIDQQDHDNVSDNHRKKTAEAVQLFWTNAFQFEAISPIVDQ